MLHSICILFSTVMNANSHVRLNQLTSPIHACLSLPTWLSTAGQKGLLKRLVNQPKYGFTEEEAKLTAANPRYAYIRPQNGKETTVFFPEYSAPTGHIQNCFPKIQGFDLSLKILRHYLKNSTKIIIIIMSCR